METKIEGIVIVGAGIAGLATALGLNRLGIRSLVLESSDSLRTTGFALATWKNAWRALDALGVGDSLRQQHIPLHGLEMFSTLTGQCTAQISFDSTGRQDVEIYAMKRKCLLETLEKELPIGTIRYSAKVVSIEESGYLKLVHLADGSVIKTMSICQCKVLIGCDGVNSSVAKWLGFKKPAFPGRFAIRAYFNNEQGHGFDPRALQYLGDGIRAGFIPCDEKTIFWFFTWSRNSKEEEEIEENPARRKQFMLDKLGKAQDRVRAIVEQTEYNNTLLSQLRYRYPWELIWGNISKGNVCVAGDALHPMTPDIAQGGCAALEDSIVLARCLGEALKNEPIDETEENTNKVEEAYKRIEIALKKYAEERRWRSIQLITTAYMVGYILQSKSKVLNFFREKILGSFVGGSLLRPTRFDCGELNAS